MRTHFPGWLLLLGALTAIGPLSIDMYLPAFMSIAEGLHATQGQVERTLPMFLAGLAIGQLFYGPLSDRFGRRPPLMLGLSIYMLGSAGCALASNVDVLSAWRLVQALGGGVGMVVARAVIRDRLDPQASARAISKLMLVMGLAPILAPLAGGWMLAVASWRGIFAVQAGFGALCLLWAILRLPETRPASAVQRLHLLGALRTYGGLVRDPQLLWPALCGGFGMAGLFAYIAGSPFALMGVYGLDRWQYGLVFGLNAFGLIVVSQLNGWWLHRHLPLTVLRHTTILPGLASITLLLISLSGAPPISLLAACLLLYVASLGAITPNTMALAMAAHGRTAGAASALLGSVSFLLGMGAGLAVSAVDGMGVLPMAAVIAVCGAASTITGWATLRTANCTNGMVQRVEDVEPIA